MKRLGLLVCLVFLAGGVLATSVNGVSGDFDDGGNVVITGSGFGSHDLDIQWLGGADGVIENTDVGSVPVLSGWTFDSFSENFAASDFAHSGTKSLKNDIKRSGPYAASIRYGWHDAIGPDEDIFISWWVRRVHVGLGQWKMFRMSYENDITDGPVEIVMFNWDHSRQFYVRPGPTTTTVGDRMYGPYPEEDNKWYRLDLTIHTSNVGASDGSYVLNLADPDSGVTIKENSIDNAMSYADSSKFYRWFLWQNYIGNDVDGVLMQSQNTWTDDIYIQVGTHARVEIGDAASWSDCTFREIQKPSSWSDGVINFDLNKGGFDEGDVAYVYVVGDDDSVNENGYPITIGSGAEIDCSGDVDGDLYGDGLECLGTDCDDSDSSVHEEVSCTDYSDCSSVEVCGVCEDAPTEVCDNSLDDDCDGSVDENCEGGEGGEDGGVVGYEVVVDNDDASVSMTGSGWEASSYYEGFYGEDYMYTYDESGSFVWGVDLNVSGGYEVYAWWSSVSGRPSDVSYSFDGHEVVVNQEEDGGEWVKLGEFDFDEGEVEVVLTSGDSAQGVCADAVKFVLKSGVLERKGDLNGDGVVDFGEVEMFVLRWVGGEVSIGDLLEVVNGWKGL